jgi:uncharacterized membrane protein
MSSTETNNGTDKKSDGPQGEPGGAVKKNPIIQRLLQELRRYVQALIAKLIGNLMKKLTALPQKLIGKLGGLPGKLIGKLTGREGGGPLGAAAAAGAETLAEGGSPAKAGIKALWTGVKEKIKSLFGKGRAGPKVTNIVEDLNVGVPISVAYDQWSVYEEFPSFMKGPEGVDKTDEVHSNWRVKIWLVRRSFTATVVEQIPDRKIQWTSEGAKGTTRGVVTFHPLADDLTRILLVMEYYPKGILEKIGNLWRAVGRRTRLDLKHFRRFIMQRGEATGSWRGEIHDGEVVRQPEEVEEEERQPEEEREEEREAPERAELREGEEREPEEREEGEREEGEREPGEEEEEERTERRPEPERTPSG